MVDDGTPTAEVLREVLGFRSAGEDESLARFQATEAIGGLVDIRTAKGFCPGGKVAARCITSLSARLTMRRRPRWRRSL
jgi:hypothetical protein